MVYRCLDPGDDWDAYCEDQYRESLIDPEDLPYDEIEKHLDEAVKEVLGNKDASKLLELIDEIYRAIDREPPLALVMHFKKDDREV